jgi:hypothetical protein
MDKTLEKREDLQLFVKEQIIGPGAFNKRYFFLTKWLQNEFVGKDINTCRAIDNISEIISEVPAYQYSSGILFPISQRVQSASNKNPDDVDAQETPDDDIQASGYADDENLDDDKSESVSNRNQNYPNSFGLSFAVRLDSVLKDDLKVQMEYRTYRKVSQDLSRENKLAFFVSENKIEIARIFSSYFSEIFSTETIDNNLFIYLKSGVDINTHLYTLDYVNIERFVSTELLPKVKFHFEKEEVYTNVVKVYDKTEFSFTSLYTEKIYDKISTVLRSKPDSYSDYKALILLLELYNQLKEIVTELKTIYRKSSKRNKPKPIWEATIHKIPIVLVDRDKQKRIQRGVIAVPESDNLDLNYQYLSKIDRVTGIENLYVKLVIVNKHVVEIEEDEPPQLNKKDEANKKSLFGIRLSVQETRKNILVSYNPPNLLNFDEEDSLNKVLYRKYQDFGEGYNASVAWGVQSNKSDLHFISTEFLPEQDTPNVDFKPSKVEKGTIVPLVNDETLAFRKLSTLTSKKDNEILSDLKDFVDQYGKWIKDKEHEVSLIENLSGKELLIKQLRGCSKDYNRLHRNIRLLANDKAAMAAFRLMNTAMFMQLHHSIRTKPAIKNSAQAFTPTSNDAEYYRSLTLADEYKWRSFQVAFVLLNVDGFVRPPSSDLIVDDVFETGWPERNEIADLVWFPTGGGKTEAYLGLIAFAIIYRRFVNGKLGNGTTVLMRYTLRLLTLQQFQRATLLICALEAIRKDGYVLPEKFSLGVERITIGLFVGDDSLPNRWKGTKNKNGMFDELQKIKEQLKTAQDSGRQVKLRSRLPHTNCPWCGGLLFVDADLPNVFPSGEAEYGIDDRLIIVCNTSGCTYYNKRTTDPVKSLPLCLFDEDIFKFPPTLLFGTVDKFAALANKVSNVTNERNQDSRRLFGNGKGQGTMPPDLIIQDELHLLLGPLGSAVGLFEKAIDECCSYQNKEGIRIRPKIITSTATTRNTDKQIFALFNRRSEVFPKQGISFDDSFFAFYKRSKLNPEDFESNRRYVGVLPVGKTQVWMQLRLASIFLVHRVKFLKRISKESLFTNTQEYQDYVEALDYYHTLLSYFNSLKEVGKTQSQLGHYLPGDVNQVYKNTLAWDLIDKMIRGQEINSGELTGRLSGEEVKTSLSQIEKSWDIMKANNPPEFVIATNMISVGIDISRLNTMLINSMPRNTAEYIQATSRVARQRKGIVFTVHHPFRSRDISHYQRFKEYHEKFYGYVEPISVTPFASKALERYLAMYLAVIIRHNNTWGLTNNGSAALVNADLTEKIRKVTFERMAEIKANAEKLNKYLQTRKDGLNASIEGIIEGEELLDIQSKIEELLNLRWLMRKDGTEPPIDLQYRDDISITSLFTPRNGLAINDNWNVKQSLREIAPSIIIKTVQQ